MAIEAPREAPVHDPEERAVQVGRLGDFLRWLLPLALIFGLIEIIAASPTQTVGVALTGLIILVYAAAVVGARMLLRRGRLEAAVRITSGGIMITAILIAIVQPELWPPLATIPLVAVGVALPYTRGVGLVRLLVASGAGAVAIATIGSIGTFPEVGTVGGHPSSLPSLFLSAYVVGALGAVATLVLVLLFQFSTRPKTALDEAVGANRALLTARSALESERERLDTTLRSIGDGVIATDDGGLIVFMNPVAERCTDWPQAEAIGQPLERVLELGEDDPDRDQAFEPGPVLIARDGVRRPVALARSPIQSGAGPVHGAVTVFRDVTDERRLAGERLEIDRRILENQKLESLATLAGGIAQQFNNLLVVIIGNATIARDELEAGGPDDVVASALDDIEAAAGRAAVLAQQMLAFGGRGRFLLTRFDVAEVISETGGLLGATLPATVSIRYDVKPGLPAIEADNAQIRQLLLAILVNAVEAIGDHGGTITIAARAETIAAVHGTVHGTVTGAIAVTPAGMTSATTATEGPFGTHPDAPVVVVDVTDTGHGMDEATRRQVFQPFFTTRFVGRGLGLAAALGIVRGHLGRIEVRSTPGVGSTFRVILPALEDARPTAIPMDGVALAAGALSPAGPPSDAGGRQA